MFSFQEEPQSPVRIKVIGVGGAGRNTVNTMITGGLCRVDFVAPVPSLKWDATPRWKVKMRFARVWSAPTWCLSPPAWAAAPGRARLRSWPALRVNWAS